MSVCWLNGLSDGIRIFDCSHCNILFRLHALVITTSFVKNFSILGMKMFGPESFGKFGSKLVYLSHVFFSLLDICIYNRPLLSICLSAQKSVFLLIICPYLAYFYIIAVIIVCLYIRITYYCNWLSA